MVPVCGRASNRHFPGPQVYCLFSCLLLFSLSYLQIQYEIGTSRNRWCINTVPPSFSDIVLFCGSMDFKRDHLYFYAGTTPLSSRKQKSILFLFLFLWCSVDRRIKSVEFTVSTMCSSNYNILSSPFTQKYNLPIVT